MVKLEEVLLAKPKLKYVFICGKGGVGKTIVAAGLAYHFTSNNEKTLLASLSTLHSLSTIFMQDLTDGNIRPIEGVKNLYAVEVETKDSIKLYKKHMSMKLESFLRWANISLDVKQCINVITVNPAFQEFVLFNKVIDLILEGNMRFDKIIFDTASVVNAIQLMKFCRTYRLWLTRIIKSRREALLFKAKSSSKSKIIEEVKRDPLIAYFIDMNRRFSLARKVLLNPEETTFFFVTLPSSLSIAVIRRLIEIAYRFNVPIGGIIVNQVIPKSVGEVKSIVPYVKSRYEEQLRCMRSIMRDLGDLIVSYIPMYSSEIIGINMVRKVAEDLVRYEPDFICEIKRR